MFSPGTSTAQTSSPGSFGVLQDLLTEKKEIYQAPSPKTWEPLLFGGFHCLALPLPWHPRGWFTYYLLHLILLYTCYQCLGNPKFWRQGLAFIQTGPFLGRLKYHQVPLQNHQNVPPHTPQKKLHQHRPQTVFKHEIAFALALFTDKKRMSWQMPKAHAACITRGPEKGGFRCGPALHKDTLNMKYGHRKTQRKPGQTIQIQKTRTKVGKKRQGANARRRSKADKSTAGRTAGKGTAKPCTKTSTKAGKSGHRADKGSAKAKSGQRADKERTKRRQGADTRRTQRATWQTKTLEARPKRTQGRQGECGHKGAHGGPGRAAKSDTWRTQGHRRTSLGTWPEHIAASIFVPKTKLHQKLFGEKTKRPASQARLMSWVRVHPWSWTPTPWKSLEKMQSSMRRRSSVESLG